MSKTREYAQALLDLRAALRAVKADPHNYRVGIPATEENTWRPDWYYQLARAVSLMEETMSSGDERLLDELLHHWFDCGEPGCTNDTCKQNPNGNCENCGSSRRAGQHYSTEVWKYLCERN